MTADKANLVIETVTYTRTRLRGVENGLDYTITLRNIGDETFDGPLSISWTESKYDIEHGHYSHAALVNSPGQIEPGETFTTTKMGKRPDSTSVVRFRLKTEQGEIDNSFDLVLQP